MGKVDSAEIRTDIVGVGGLLILLLLWGAYIFRWVSGNWRGGEEDQVEMKCTFSCDCGALEDPPRIQA